MSTEDGNEKEPELTKYGVVNTEAQKTAAADWQLKLKAAFEKLKPAVVKDGDHGPS